jgi:hypothetical protein
MEGVNNNVPHQQNAYLSMHLIAIETIIRPVRLMVSAADKPANVVLL